MKILTITVEFADSDSTETLLEVGQNIIDYIDEELDDTFDLESISTKYKIDTITQKEVLPFPE